MGRLRKAIKAGVTGYQEAAKGTKYVAAGKAIQCPHCGKSVFETGEVLLNTPGLTLLGLDWANRAATVLICKNCSRIEWFLQKPDIVW